MNDVITYWNRGAEALYGWGRDQAIGKVTHQLLQTSFPAPFEEITAELLRSDRWEGELGHAKQDGQRLVVASRWALQRDDRGRPVAILETNTDVTDRKRAEERLREAEKELRATIDTIPAMVMRVAVDGTVEFVNARWSEEGFSEEGLLADWTAYVHPDDLAEFVKVRTRSLATGEAYEAEVRFRRMDGDTAGVSSASSACGTKRESPSSGIRRRPISRTGSGPRMRCAAARPCWRRRKG